jgi:hypothetical protein
MFLTLLVIAAVLLCGWIFTSIFKVSHTGTAKSSVSPDKKVALWSLLLLIFFPEFNASKLSLPPQE